MVASIDLGPLVPHGVIFCFYVYTMLGGSESPALPLFTFNVSSAPSSTPNENLATDQLAHMYVTSGSGNEGERAG